VSGKGDRTVPALHDYRPTCTRLIDAAYIGYTEESFGNFDSPKLNPNRPWQCG